MEMNNLLDLGNSVALIFYLFAIRNQRGILTWDLKEKKSSTFELFENRCNKFSSASLDIFEFPRWCTKKINSQ